MTRYEISRQLLFSNLDGRVDAGKVAVHEATELKLLALAMVVEALTGGKTDTQERFLAKLNELHDWLDVNNLTSYANWMVEDARAEMAGVRELPSQQPSQSPYTGLDPRGSGSGYTPLAVLMKEQETAK